MHKRLTIFIFFISLFPLPTWASGNGVVINSFQVSGLSSTDEFIEIYNSSELSVDLSGWRLSKKTKSGNLYGLVPVFSDAVLEPKSGIIVGHQNYTKTSDLKYATANSLAEDNTIILFSDAGKTVVDKVGFGAAGDFEGMALPNLNKNEVYSRKTPGMDTDNNIKDFYLSYVPKPPAPVPTKDSHETHNNKSYKVVLSEFIPNPDGPDGEGEWIEIYNPGPKADIGGLIITDKIGSPKEYKVPAGLVIGAQEFMLFFAKKTRISLNNDGDIVELKNGTGKIISSSGKACGKGKEGFSYAFDGNSWRWTKWPTPGAKNIIQEPSAEELNSKKDEERQEQGKVLGMVAEGDLANNSADAKKGNSDKDRLFGYALIFMAIVGGITYTLYVNREKIVGFLFKKRKRDNQFWERIRRKFIRR